MKNEEAKFLLRAYRPDGDDARDPLFADALAQADHDPLLRTWLEREQQGDRLLAAKLAQVQPPPGLREAILIGARASQRSRRWWRNPAWFAAAAALIVLIGVAVRFGGIRLGSPSTQELAAFALTDLSQSHDAHTLPAALAGVQAQFTRGALPLPAHLDLNLDELRRQGCRTVRLAGRDVFELCFQRDGVWFHLYAGRREDFSAGSAAARTLVLARGQFAAASWSDAKNVYALVTGTGEATLRRLL